MKEFLVDGLFNHKTNQKTWYLHDMRIQLVYMSLWFEQENMLNYIMIIHKLVF